MWKVTKCAEYNDRNLSNADACSMLLDITIAPTLRSLRSQFGELAMSEADGTST